MKLHHTAFPVPEQAHSFAFLGEAGCGKSEIAINLALSLAAQGERPVHFFDLDMTKPLFRSRDQAVFLEANGVTVHFEEQFYDAPTTAGGVARLLEDAGCCTVLDVGGDYIGARSVGGYAPWLNRPGTVVWYVVNPYRPWSADIEPETAAQEVLEGAAKLQDLLRPYKEIDFYTVKEDLARGLEGRLPGQIVPIRLMLTYEWAQD